MKSYSDVVKGVDIESTEIPIVTVQGISVADGYDINLIPRPDIDPDGNCVIKLGMDQMKRFVYGIIIC